LIGAGFVGAIAAIGMGLGQSHCISGYDEPVPSLRGRLELVICIPVDFFYVRFAVRLFIYLVAIIILSYRECVDLFHMLTSRTAADYPDGID
jgi:hypothetical protein